MSYIGKIIWLFYAIRYTIYNIVFLRKIRRNEYYIFENEKLIYIRIEKCASTTMLNCLKSLIKGGKRKMWYHNFSVIHKLEPAHLNGSYQIFTIIRNPLDRLISSYVYLHKIKDNKKKEGILREKYYYYGLVFHLFKKNSFEDFCKKIIKIPSFLSDNHFRPMNDFLGIDPSYITFIDMNDLEEQFETIRKKYNLPKLQKENVGNKDKQISINNLSEELLEKIKKKYKKDFDLYKQVEEIRRS